MMCEYGKYSAFIVSSQYLNTSLTCNTYTDDMPDITKEDKSE